MPVIGWYLALRSPFPIVHRQEFNFGELTQQEIIPSLEGSPYAWIRELLQAFSEGKFDLPEPRRAPRTLDFAAKAQES